MVLFVLAGQIATSILKGFRTNKFRYINVGIYAALFVIELLVIIGKDSKSVYWNVNFMIGLSFYAYQLYKLIKQEEKTFIEK